MKKFRHKISRISGTYEKAKPTNNRYKRRRRKPGQKYIKYF